jgi:hypothetical protein
MYLESVTSASPTAVKKLHCETSEKLNAAVRILNEHMDSVTSVHPKEQLFTVDLDVSHYLLSPPDLPRFVILRNVPTASVLMATAFATRTTSERMVSVSSTFLSSV